MLTHARRFADRRKWALRGVGALIMWGGSAMTLSFLPALASRLPLFGALASSLAGASVALLSLATVPSSDRTRSC